VRARVGYAWDRFLVYGTGGFAYGQVNSAASASIAANGGAVAISTSQNNGRSGWTAGGGLCQERSGRWFRLALSRLNSCVFRPSPLFGWALTGLGREINQGLVELIKEAFSIRNQLLSGSDDSIEAMSARLGMNKFRITSLVRLSYLAPDIIRALLAGQHPIALTATRSCC